MALTDNSVLFHLDASAGGGRPSVGKLLTYERASAANQLNGDGRFSKVLRDTPKLHTIQTNDGNVYTALGLEQSITQLASAPFNLNASSWEASAGITKTHNLPSAFDDENVLWATRITDDGSDHDNSLAQSAGDVLDSASQDYQVFSVVAEVIIPTFFSIGIFASGFGFVVLTRWHLTVDGAINEDLVENPAGFWPVSQATQLGRGPNGGLLVMFSVMGRGTNDSKGALRQLVIFPSGHGKSETKAPVIHYAGLVELSDIPMPLWGSVSRDNYRATGFKYQSHVGYLSWINFAPAEFAHRYNVNPILAWFGSNEGGNHRLGISTTTFGSNYRIQLAQGHPSFASRTVIVDIVAKIGDVIEVMWGFDVESEHMVIRALVNGVLQSTQSTTDIIHADMTSWGDNVITLGSRYTFSTASALFAPMQMTILKMVDAVPDHEQLTAHNLGSRILEVFAAVDILHTGKLY